MSRKNEDFDEFCDPENPKTLQFSDIQSAHDRIRDSIIKTPCPASKYQKSFSIHLYYKCEFVQKTGSFKERGAANVLSLLPLDKKKIGVVVGSIGNEGHAMCLHAAALNIPITVVMPNKTPISKVQKCHSLGAKVFIQGGTLQEAHKYARAIAREKGLTYINGRDHPHILAGYGSLAVEIVEVVPNVDCVIVPVGSGGLAAAVAVAIKHLKPDCLVYGVEPESMPVCTKSLENRSPIQVYGSDTMSDAIGVTNLGTNAFHNLQPLLDKMLQVNDEWVARSVLHLLENERFVVEGAGACSLAPIIGNLVPELKLKNVVCILSGGNIDGITLNRTIDRGLAMEGRLVEFKVTIGDSAVEHNKLLEILKEADYEMVTMFQQRKWVDIPNHYLIEMKIACLCKDMQDALQLKRILDKVYPCENHFEVEPFNDTRTCPCFIKKDCKRNSSLG